MCQILNKIGCMQFEIIYSELCPSPHTLVRTKGVNKQVSSKNHNSFISSQWTYIYMVGFSFKLVSSKISFTQI